MWGFPGSPVIKTPHFHFSGHRFDPWLENEDATWHSQKKKEKERKFCHL